MWGGGRALLEVLGQVRERDEADGVLGPDQAEKVVDRVVVVEEVVQELGSGGVDRHGGERAAERTVYERVPHDHSFQVAGFVHGR